MAQIRKDHVLDEYVCISPSRGKRPHEFSADPSGEGDGSGCPFCPRNRDGMLPPILDTFDLSDEADGLVLTDNKFPIVSGTGPAGPLAHDDLYCSGTVHGRHLVLIEGKAHGARFGDFSVPDISATLRAYQQVYRRLWSVDGARFVGVFKNEGAAAGASIHHPHSQAASLSFVPVRAQARLQAYQRSVDEHGRCPYCRVFERERAGERCVRDADGWVVLCPWASRVPFETVLYPTMHTARFADLDDQQVHGLAVSLKVVLSRLASLDAPYNLTIHEGVGDDYHLHLSVVPRLTTRAGFELETGILVNPLPPEEAADYLRQ